MSQMNPRPEAQPQTYDSLSKTQQRAVSGILQYLDQFVATAPFPTAESETMVRLDLIRPSNVVLIDGERGSGKTETLLTLRGFWAAAFEPNDKDLQTIRSSVDAAVKREAEPAIGIPVPVLDMQLSDELRAACDELVPPGSVAVNFHNSAAWMKMRVG